MSLESESVRRGYSPDIDGTAVRHMLAAEAYDGMRTGTFSNPARSGARGADSGQYIAFGDEPLGSDQDGGSKSNTTPNQNLTSPEYQRVMRLMRQRRDAERNLLSPGTLQFPLGDRTAPPRETPRIMHPPRDVKDLLEKKEGVSDQFIATVTKTLENIPLSVRKALADGGYRVVAADRITNAVPSLKNVRPRGWPPGTTWDHADGTQSSFQRVVAVAEFRRQGSGSDWVVNDRVPGVLRHEMGHALDVVLAKDNILVSKDDQFKVAYERDLINISAQDRAAIGYLLQPGDAGRSETFAEVFALLMGGPSNESQKDLVKRSFPEVRKVIQAKLDELERSSQSSAIKRMDLVQRK